MFKKYTIFFLSLALLLSFSAPVSADEQEDIMTITRNAGYKVDELYRPKAAIVIDSETGKILWEENSTTQRHIASMSKLMTLFVALEEMSTGRFSWATEIDVTQKYVDIASDYNLSNNKMILGAKYNMGEIFDLILVPSSNAATLMLADFVSQGDSARFVTMMNGKAKEIGMSDTLFYNCTGTVNSDLGIFMPTGGNPNGDNHSTARDMSLLAYHLIKKYPEILEHTKNPTITIKTGTPYEETFNSYLFSLPGKTYGYEGFDGLKTGSSSSAGFNYVGTAKRENTRFIQVIMGVGDWDHQESEEMRHPFGNALLDQSFGKYAYQKVLSKGKQTLLGKEIVVTKDVYDLVEKNKAPQFEFNDNGLQVKSDFPTLNKLAASQEISYEVTGFSREKKSKAKKETGKETGFFTEMISFFKGQSPFLFLKLALIAFAIVLFIMIVIELILPKGKRGRKHNPFFTTKFVLLIISLVAIIAIQFLKLT